MSRGARQVSESGFYHVMMRGCGRQILFEDDGDRLRFLSLLSEMLTRSSVVLIAWCLMTNHVHLLVGDEGRMLSEALHDLASAYAGYFNRKTGRVGAVFGGRFKSVPVESEAQLVAAARYIHDNPEKGGICPAEEYEWSSFGEYAGKPWICDTSVLLGVLGGTESLLAPGSDASERTPYHFRTGRRVPDEELLDVARAVLHPRDPMEVKGLEVRARSGALRRLSEAGLSQRQIERVTGVGRYSIQRALGKA